LAKKGGIWKETMIFDDNLSKNINSFNLFGKKSCKASTVSEMRQQRKVQSFSEEHIVND
jgi:hypothetical protein